MERKEDTVSSVVQRQGRVQQRGYRARNQETAAATDPRSNRTVGAGLLHEPLSLHPRKQIHVRGAGAPAGRSPTGISTSSHPLSLLQRRPGTERAEKR
jgi:hypothetical protein